MISAATTTGNQIANSDILNSMVSKLIHDQAESSFCWAFAISSMLRQSLKMFFQKVWDHGTVKYRSLDLIRIKGDIDVGDGCWRQNVLVTSLRCW